MRHSQRHDTPVLCTEIKLKYIYINTLFFLFLFSFFWSSLSCASWLERGELAVVPHKRGVVRFLCGALQKRRHGAASGGDVDVRLRVHTLRFEQRRPDYRRARRVCLAGRVQADAHSRLAAHRPCVAVTVRRVAHAEPVRSALPDAHRLRKRTE